MAYYLTKEDYLKHANGMSRRIHKYISKYVKNGKTYYRYAKTGRNKRMVNGNVAQIQLGRTAGIGPVGEGYNVLTGTVSMNRNQNGGTVGISRSNTTMKDINNTLNGIYQKGKKFVSKVLNTIRTISIKVQQINKPTGTYLKDFIDSFKK